MLLNRKKSLTARVWSEPCPICSAWVRTPEGNCAICGVDVAERLLQLEPQPHPPDLRGVKVALVSVNYQKL